MIYHQSCAFCAILLCSCICWQLKHFYINGFFRTLQLDCLKQQIQLTTPTTLSQGRSHHLWLKRHLVTMRVSTRPQIHKTPKEKDQRKNAEKTKRKEMERKSDEKWKLKKQKRKLILQLLIYRFEIFHFGYEKSSNIVSFLTFVKSYVDLNQFIGL